jgi:acyl carrier protein
MISEAEFLGRFAPIFREELEQDALQVTLSTSQADTEAWDSLAHVRVVVGVEREFGVQLDVAEIENINTVRGFYDAVLRHAG